MKKLLLKVSAFILMFIFGLSISFAKEIDINSIKNKNWQNLATAGENLNAGYYRLEGDYYFDKQITSNLSSNQNIYIDLNGHSLTYGGWANWEDPENKIPPKYKGTVNAAFYGTRGNIYFLDSTGKNTEIKIDFSLVDGFDNVTIQGITYNASAWRNLIITKNLELYDVSIDDINHGGAASINITGDLTIKDSTLKVQTMYFGANANINDSEILFYGTGSGDSGDYSFRYGGIGTINIVDSNIEFNQLNVVAGTNPSFNKAIFKVNNSTLKVNTEQKNTNALSMVVGGFEFIDSTLTNIAHIGINETNEYNNKIINTNLKLLGDNSGIIVVNNNKYLSNIQIEDSEIEASSNAIFMYFNKIIFKDSNVKIVNVLNSSYDGQTKSGAIFYEFRNLEVDNVTINTEGGFATSLASPEGSVSVKNSDITALSTNGGIACLNVPRHTLEIYDTVIKTQNKQSNMPDINAKSAKLEKITFNGSTFNIAGDLTIKDSDILIYSMGGQAYFLVKGNLDVDGSKLISNDDPTKNPNFLSVNGTARITNSEIVTHGKEYVTDDATYSPAKIYITKDAYFENVNYYGGLINFNANAIIKNTDLYITPGQGAPLLNVEKNFEVYDSSIISDAQPNKISEFILAKGDAIIKDTNIRTRKEGLVVNEKNTPEFTIAGRAELENVEYYGGLIKLGKGGTVKSSIFKQFHESSADLFVSQGDIEINDTTITRLEGSTSHSPTIYLNISGNTIMKNVDIIMEDVEKMYGDASGMDLARKGVVLNGDSVLENFNYDGGAVSSAGSLTIKNAKIRSRTKDFSAVNGIDLTIEDSEVELSARDNKDVPLFASGTLLNKTVTNLKNFTGKTDTNIVIGTKAHLDGDICLESSGDFDINLNSFGDITLGKDVMITCEVGIFNMAIEKDISLPVIPLGFETTIEEFKPRTMNFVNPYHDEYMLRYEASDNNLYWDLKQKITFIDRTMSDVVYFFKNEHITKDDKITYSQDGKTYEFVGWYSNPDGTGKKFISGESVEEDNLVYYAVWKEVENPITGFKSIVIFLIGLSVILITTVILRRKKNLFYKI